jgi:hypothetical protein
MYFFLLKYFMFVNMKIIFLLFFILLLFTEESYSKSDDFKILNQIVIFKEEGLYACFPNMFSIKDTLVVGFSTRLTNSHYDKNGGGKRFISTDSGLSWNETEKQLIFPGYKNNKSQYIITVPKNWKQINKDRVEKVKAAKIVVKYSKGKYWQSTGMFQKELSLQGKLIFSESLSLPQHALLMGTNLSSYIRKDSGLRILSLFGKIDPDQSRNQVFLLRSSNDGSSWDFIIPYNDSSLSKIGLGETALLETGIDSILGISRGSDGFLYSSRSVDDGLSWSSPKKMPIWGHPANLISIDENQILCTYGYRRNPIGVRAVVLDKNTLNIISDTFTLRNNGKGNPFDSGYPMTLILEDKTFFTSFYFTGDDGITHIAGTKWSIN